MDTKYIHTHQLLEARRSLDINLGSLKTFISWTLFANKSNVSPGIATIETKARLLRDHYRLSAEEVVERVYEPLVVSLMKYAADGRKTIKAFLLTAINYNLDKIMSSAERIESFSPQQPIRTYHGRTFDTDFAHLPKITEDDNSGEVFGRAGTKMPSTCVAKSPIVKLRKKVNPPEIRTFADFYDDDF